MKTITLTNIDDVTMNELEKRAKAKGLSIEEEAKALLRDIVKKKIPIGRGWPEGWFEKTCGCLKDIPFERPD